MCVALQIKSGVSYRTGKGDYVVPVEHHADLWRRSTVPVFGMVYDPDDLQLRWVDLTGYQKCARGRAKWLGGLATEVAVGTAIADCISVDISGDFDGGPSSPVEVAECLVAETAAA